MVGGFFSKEARESSYAKVSVGTFPKLPIKKADANRVVVKKFKKALRASQHAAIANCYREYNAKGGRIVPLQTGDQVQLRRKMTGDQPRRKMTGDQLRRKMTGDQLRRKMTGDQPRR